MKLRALTVVPLGLVALVLVGLPVLALTETGLERDLKGTFGYETGCKGETNESSRWQPEASLPAKRDEPRAATLGPFVYLFGGTDRVVQGDGGRLLLNPLANATRFDTRSGSYTEVAPMPRRLNHQGVAVYKGDVYVLGGYGRRIDAGTRREFYRYDPDRDRWAVMPSLPEPRAAMAVGVIGDQLIAAGGANNRTPLTSAVAFDFKRMAWTRLPSLPDGREHVAGAVLDGRFYVLGGRDLDVDARNDATVYDPRAKRWERLPRMPVPSGGLDAVASDDAVIAFGGGNDRGGSVTGAVQRFSPESGSWSRLSDMRTPRHGFAGALSGGKLYAFGGSPCAYFSASDSVESLRLERQ